MRTANGGGRPECSDKCHLSAAVGFEDLIIALSRSVFDVITHQPPTHCGQGEWKWLLVIVPDGKKNPKQTTLIQVFLIKYAVITQQRDDWR